MTRFARGRRSDRIIDPDVDLHDPQQAQPSDFRRELPVLIAVAVGGVIGAEARYGIGRALPHTSAQFPLATLLINSTGCLMLGILMVLVTERMDVHRLVRPFLGVGVLGGYTTFSSFAVDVQDLVNADRALTALLYWVMTLAVGWLAVWAGIAGTRRFGPPETQGART